MIEVPKLRVPFRMGEGQRTPLVPGTTYEDLVLGRPELETYYRLNEEAGTTFADSSGNGNDGIVSPGITNLILGADGMIVNDPDKALEVGPGNANAPMVQGPVGYYPWASGGADVIVFEAVALRAAAISYFPIFASTDSGDCLLVQHPAVATLRMSAVIGGVTVHWPDNSWPGDGEPVHVLCKYDPPADTLDLWINGAPLAQKTGLGNATGTRMAFGGSGFSDYARAGDKLDEIAIYRGWDPTDEEVEEHYVRATEGASPETGGELLASAKAAVVEQDTIDEVYQCVVAIARTERGSRIDEPEFGIPDQAFREQMSNIITIIEEWEPRARVVLSSEELENAIRTAFVNVDTREA